MQTIECESPTEYEETYRPARRCLGNIMLLRSKGGGLKSSLKAARLVIAEYEDAPEAWARAKVTACRDWISESAAVSTTHQNQRR